MELWHKKSPLVFALIHALYELPGCGCGGIAHVIIDDENIEDDDLKWGIEYIHSNDDRVSKALEKDLVELLYNTLLEMSYEQRIAIFEMLRLDIIDEDSYKQNKELLLDHMRYSKLTI